MPPTLTGTALLRAWLEYPISGGPAVSFDGRWVTFVSNRSGLPQAWTASIDGGEPFRVPTPQEGVGGLAASPDGPDLLLTLDRGGDEHWQLYLREGDPGDPARSVRPLTHDPSRIHELGVWRDADKFVFASNRRDERFFDIYEASISRAEEPRLLRQEDVILSPLAAHGSRILIARANTNLDSDLYLLDGDRTAFLTPHTGELTVWGAGLLGGDVYAAANPDREFAALVRYRSGQSPEVVREFGADVEVLRCEPDGARVAFSVNRQGRSELHVFDTASGEERVVETPGQGVVASIAWVPRADRLVFDYSSPTAGQEVWSYDLRSRALRPVTKSPVAMPGPTVEPSLHSFRAEDGLEVPYWEYAPSRGTARGTILLVHGGPESQARPSFDSGLLSFFVAEGWRIVQPNVRGSTGYGRSYVHLDDVRKRMDSVRDLRDLVTALVLEGKARPGEVGIFGGSYGGFMVLSAISTYPDLWGAAVDFFGISNFVTFLEHTGPWRRAVREAEYGSLEKDRTFLEEISPIHHVDRIVTPLLVAQGDNDPRVPLEEAEQIVEALRRRHVPVEFLRYGNEGHGFVRLENQVDSFGRSAEFLASHLGRAASAQGAGSR